jgi:inner membrane protein
MPPRDGVCGEAELEGTGSRASGRSAGPRAAGVRSVASAWIGEGWPAALLCAGGVLLIGLLDLAQRSGRWSVPMTAVLDEPAHLATAALLLATCLPRRARAVVPWALAGAVLIDLDHIPLYLWGALTSDGYGRPVTHSLLTVLVLAGAGLLFRGRARTALLGLALGVGLHLVRDLGTGPGVPLWWPLGGHSVVVPYAAYFAVVLTAAALATARALRQGPRGRAQPPA